MRYRSGMDMPTQVEDLRGLLTGHGVRPTAQRLLVLEALAATDDATAQAVHERLRRSGARVGLATVYRSLALLSERGVVDVLSHRPGEACYRLCGGGHHHHLVCTSCHRVVELRDCSLDAWLADIAAEHGFSLTGHELEVSGLCSSCR